MQVGDKVKVEALGKIISAEIDEKTNTVFYKVRLNESFGYGIFEENHIKEESKLSV